MDFADVARFILYAWLAVSLCVYGYRLYRRFLKGNDVSTAGESETARPRGAPVPTRTAGTPLPRARPAPDDEGSTPTDPSDPGPIPLRATNQVSPPRDGSLVEAVIREELDARKQKAADEEAGADPAGDAEPDATADRGAASPGTAAAEVDPPAAASHRTGLFAPLAKGRPTVAEALEGVALPCDLAPLMGGSTEIDPHRVVFVTSGHAPGVVGSKLADELERLGFVMDTTSESAAIATRDGIVVTIELYEDAARANRDGERLFPTAPGGSVAVALST